MKDTTTTVVTTALISVIEVIVVMIAMMTVAMTGTTIDVVRMTTTAKTISATSEHLRHRPRDATPMVHSKRQTARSTSLLEVAKRSKPTGRLDQTPGRSGMSTPKIHDLYGGLNSQSHCPGKIIGSTFGPRNLCAGR
jgi:flagellar motor component MotA